MEKTVWKRFSTKSVLLLALVVVGASGIAYGIASGLNNALASANTSTQNQYYGGWGPYSGRFGPRFGNTTSSFIAVSRVDSVSVTAFSIANTNQVSVTLSYGGTGTTPAITVVAMAPGLSGSNILSAGWSSPTTVTVSMTGTGSLSSTWHTAVLIVPYTGA